MTQLSYWEGLVYLSVAIVMTQKYHSKVGEYLTGGFGNFVELLQLRVRGGDKMLEQHLKTCSEMQVIFQKLDKMIWLAAVGNLLQN